jgi:HSP20 family molecular chaperone IbpA
MHILIVAAGPLHRRHPLVGLTAFLQIHEKSNPADGGSRAGGPRNHIPCTIPVNSTGRIRERCPTSPFTLLQRFFTDDMNGLLDQSVGRRGRVAPLARSTYRDLISWVPKVDVVQQRNELVVRADVPGVDAKDLTVEISEDAITISGERKEDRVEENDGTYRVERAYGAFFSRDPPARGRHRRSGEGPLQGRSSRNPVPAPSAEASRGRRLEISHDDNAEARKRTTNAERSDTGASGR